MTYKDLSGTRVRWVLAGKSGVPGLRLLPRDGERLGANQERCLCPWQMKLTKPVVTWHQLSAPNLTSKPCCEHAESITWLLAGGACNREDPVGSSPCLWNSHHSSTEFQASSFVSAPQVRSFTASTTVRCSSAAQFTVSEQFKTLTTSPKQSVLKPFF